MNTKRTKQKETRAVARKSADLKRGRGYLVDFMLTLKQMQITAQRQQAISLKPS